MTRLAVLVFTLTTLPWSGDSFATTLGSSSKTTTGPNSSRSQTNGGCYERAIPRIRAKPLIRRQREHQQLAQQTPQSFSSPILTSLLAYRRSSSLLNAALITDSPAPSQSKRGENRRRSAGAHKKGSGWRRRILGKISWRRQPQRRHGGSELSSSLPSSSVDHEGGPPEMLVPFGVYDPANLDDDADFVARNFELSVPEEILPVVQVDQEEISVRPYSPVLEVDPKLFTNSEAPVIDSEYFDVSIKAAESTKELIEGPSKTSTNAKKGVVCRVLENVLTERIGQRWAIETPDNLEVDVRSSSDKYNNIGRLLFKGHYRADATLSSNRIVFPMIQFSSICLQLEQVTLSLMGFFANNENYYNSINNNGKINIKENQKDHKEQGQKNQDRHEGQSNTASASVSSKAIGTVRYPEQFELHIENLTMSRKDLMSSSCIKNGLRQLLINILKDRGIRSDSIQITSINILRNGKISCIGEGKTHFPSAPPVRFEVRSGISYSNRGHVLTFPGLEISLNRDIGLFIPVHPTLDLDVGHNTKFRSIVIDGRKKQLKIAASVTITPDRTRLTQDYVQTSDGFSAVFFYDVGRWLTRLFRFSI